MPLILLWPSLIHMKKINLFVHQGSQTQIAYTSWVSNSNCIYIKGLKLKLHIHQGSQTQIDPRAK